MNKLILLSLVLFVSCQGSGDIRKPDLNLIKYEDKQNNIVCYSIHNYATGGLSCVQLRKE